jgi:acyl carrier protein
MLETALTYEAAVKAVVGAVVGVTGTELGTVDADTRLWSLDDSDPSSLDVDSLDILEVMLDLEEALGLSFIEDIDPSSLVTVGDLAGLVVRAPVADTFDRVAG